jgi:acyl-CoA thioester hydrolase
MSEKHPTRDDYSFFMEIPTRWNDNDMLGHVNNVTYYSYFEAVVVKFVMEELGIDWYRAPHVPYTAENLCRYRRALRFPETILGALRIGRIGRTSYTYELALFRDGEEAPVADGYWVHVMVERDSERPTPLTDPVRAALARHVKAGA